MRFNAGGRPHPGVYSQHVLHLQVSVGDETEILVNNRCSYKMTAHFDVSLLLTSYLNVILEQGISVISILLAFSISERNTPPFKGALYGIEPSTRNSNIWPTREEAALSVPKISC